MFGLEEILLDSPKRIIRARCLENTECLYGNKTAIMEFLHKDDKT